MKKTLVALFLTAALLGSYVGLAGAAPQPPSPIPGDDNLPKYLMSVQGNYSGNGAYITSGTIAEIKATVELVIDQQIGQLFTGRLTIISGGEIGGGQQFTISGYVLKNGEMHFSGSIFNFPLEVRNIQKLEGQGQFGWVKGMRQLSANYLVSAFVGNESSDKVMVIQFSGGFLVDKLPLE